MDLHVYAIIVIVFFVSLGSLLFINRKLSDGKSFEDVLAEKRHLADKLYGSKQQKKAVRPKAAAVKKTKDKKPKEKKEPDQESQNDSDAQSDSLSAPESNHSPNHKGHVEFTDVEIIPDADAPKKQQTKKQKERKNSASSKTGSILANKIETPAATTSAPTSAAIDTLNHFEQIIPKDDFEIKKQKEENIVADKTAVKKDKKVKGKRDLGNASPKNESTVVAAAGVEKDVVATTTAAAAVTESAVIHKDSPKPSASKASSSNKKNKVQPASFAIDQDAISVNLIMSVLGQAELSRSEIQILIDYLLNKQQDTIAANHSDWSDDVVQKLKRQLAEKDKCLVEEQEAAVGLQQKLREMRTELNAERIQNQSKLNAILEEINAKKMENQTLTQEIQIITDKFASEKQTLTVQLQQLYQENQGASQDQTNKLQQLTDANNLLTKENFSKTHLVQELQEKYHQIQTESSNKCTEYEQKLQEYDMIVRQGESQMALLNTDNQHLRTKKDDYEKMLAMQKYELEKLSAQIAEQTAKSTYLDDDSKVEIRNLQNALDSSNNELAVCRKTALENNARLEEMLPQLDELHSTVETYKIKSVQQEKQIEELTTTMAKYKSIVAENEIKINDFEKQLQSNTGKEEKLFKQIAEYKDKNNLLHSAAAAAPIINNDAADQLRTKQILQRLFPDAPAGPASYHLWIDHIAAYIDQSNNKTKQLLQQQQQQKQQINHTNNNNSDGMTTTTADANHVNNNGTLKSSATAEASSASSSTEELILQNAKLQTTVNEYKTIVAETESLLKNVEQQVQERDAYWKSIVELKDSEIQAIKTNGNSL